MSSTVDQKFPQDCTSSTGRGPNVGAATTTAINGNVRPQSAGASAPFVGKFKFEEKNQQILRSVDSNDLIDDNSSKDETDKDVEGDSQSGHEIDIEKQGQVAGGQRQQEENDPNIITWNGDDDPENPMNWKLKRKIMCTLILGLMTFVVTFASSIFSTATIATAKEFDVSTEVTTLGTSLFVLGFAFGPMVWSPMSELFGRKRPLFLGYFIFAIFNIPVAVAQNVYTIFICRFFGGFFASAPLGVTGGQLADFWDPVDRGVAIACYAASTFIGPATSPIVGGFISMSSLGWRWTQYITAIMAFFFGIIGLFVVPESSPSVILSARAKKIRYATKNWAVRAKADESQVDFKVIAEKYLRRPVAMFFLEPILVLITIYISMVYGVLYLFFEAFPITFQEQRGWNHGVGALPFISLLLGVLLASCMVSYITKTRFARKLKLHGYFVPEERLIPMMIGSILLPIGMFWFAWTSSPDITPWPQIISCIPIGSGILAIFMQGLNYLIDVYKMHANSAIAANTFVRSCIGAGFPMFAVSMYHTLGVPWATSLLGFLSIAMIPAPFLFFFYGERIRKMSRYSPT